MQSENHQPVSKLVIRNGYNFRFEFNDLSFRAGGSSVTGKEAIYVNDELVSSKSSVSNFSIFVQN